MAVGSWGSPGSQTALAELWDGRAWSVRLPVAPAHGDARLLGVSCPEPGMCVAVGDHSGGPALAEAWNGKRWAVLPLASLPGAQVGPLESVSCTSAAACTAAGSHASSSSGPGTVAERWDGVKWAVRVTPPAFFLHGVSCTAATACAAVGLSQYHNGGYRAGVAMGWDGTRWAAQAVPNPAHNAGTELSGVSCPSAGACIAVGNSTPPGRVSAALAERWNGTRWALLPAPSPGAASLLAGVSCPAAAACMAVGTADVGGGPLAERWDGARWVIVPAPSPPPVPVPGSGLLAGISCTSAASCTAVGSQQTTARTGGQVPLAVHWDGSSWSAQPVPNPVFHGQGSELAAVSCTSRRACTAVGQRGGGVSASLAERWDGHRWAVQATPHPPGNATRLLGVACTSAASCTAAGLDSPPARLLALAGHWNGVRWARQHTPPAAPGAGGILLNAVGCSSAAACTAVGQADSGPPVIERRNGTTWMMQHSPPVRSPGPGELASVSCPAAAACVAAGNTGGTEPPDFSALALAERWNGKTWAIQRLPEPPGTGSSYLTGISCSSPAACTAVGEAVLGLPAGTVTLAERWNGTRWAIQHTPNPPHGNLPGAATATLNAVSCPSATSCVAVGRSDSGALAERWNGTTWAIQHLPG
jgi:hypothetical protein